MCECFDWQLKKMNNDQVLSMFQELIQDILGQLFTEKV